jgi:hypothetical protein
MSVAASLADLGRPALLVGYLLLAGTTVALAQDPSSAPAPSEPPAPSSPAALASPATAPSAGASMAAYLPLPEQFVTTPADLTTVSVAPESEAGSLVVRTPIEYSLEHCGLWSPVDLDGSLWQPVGGHDAAGGPIASDEAIGELINATPGEFVLLTPDTAEFRSVTGVLVAFTRAPGELDYPLCM